MAVNSNNIETQVLESDTDMNVYPGVQNQAIVQSLYRALDDGDMDAVSKLLASDLEWWFHGPPKCQHMMRVLTGELSLQATFRFEPRSIEMVGDSVIAEGWEGAKAYWVHVWTVKDGLITQFREYFNTWLTVRDLRPPRCEVRRVNHTLWQSQPRDLVRRSLPGVLLAI
ncbi:wound-induced protein 1-like [Mangifera indica]|uniref:wound-induced protein 1-like n=1 Tax=Mangifera indica TaxID=29780 RepID=UPI001CFBCA2F|nr:wound-induced protein 1-like [Mangifera indica]